MDETPEASLTVEGALRLFNYDVERFEGVDGAHVLAVHCRETGLSMGARLRFDPKLETMSSFPNTLRAQSAVQEAIDARQDEIAAWLKNPHGGLRLTFDAELPEATGEVLSHQAWARGEDPLVTRAVQLVLKRNGGSHLGFVVLTAYPWLAKHSEGSTPENAPTLIGRERFPELYQLFASYLFQNWSDFHDSSEEAIAEGIDCYSVERLTATIAELNDLQSLGLDEETLDDLLCMTWGATTTSTPTG